MGRLTDMLQKNSETGAYPFHMPGHKRKTEWNINPYAYDITEIDGFDDLHNPSGVLAELNGRLAAHYGAQEALLSVNGSTAGVLAALSAAAEFGGEILFDRNSHRSAYNAVFLRHLRPQYIMPEIDAATGIALGCSAEKTDRLLRSNPDIKAVYVTSPTYEGVISDIGKIARTAHAYGVPLIVDAAHGAHLGMNGAFLENPVKEGADIVIMSLHKTLPALTQTAVICMNGELVDKMAVKRYFDMYVSSSPSYLLMASVEKCMDFLDKEGIKAFENYAAELKAFRDGCGELEKLSLWKPDGFYDIGKIVINTGGSGLSGRELAGVLRDGYGFETEMASARYVLAMTSCMDGEECFGRLLAALKEIDSGCRKESATQTESGMSSGIKQGGADPDFSGAENTPKKVYEAWETENMRSVNAGLSEAEGAVSADYVFAYPPGIPWLVPGEQINGETLRRIIGYTSMGIELTGITKTGKIRILAEK